jgi:ABC-2 type transport system ATP-binding protein
MDPIVISHLSKTYRGKKSVVKALKDVSLTITQGEVFGFLGPNGAGKSTTIKVLMGLIAATSGNAALCGKPVELAEARKLVGYLPENPALYDFLTAREYLLFVGKSFDVSPALLSRRVGEVLDLLDLREAADRHIRSYSKGMVQRLGIGQTLIHDPELYVLDEPMSGLDPLGRVLVKDIIRDLRSRGKTVFFSTHITADVEAICDRVGVIVSGELKAVDSVEKILLSGIEGYAIQVRGLHETEGTFAALRTQTVSPELAEYYVPKEMFNPFMENAILRGGKIELIETKRKDLERFFLEIVEKGSV